MPAPWASTPATPPPGAELLASRPPPAAAAPAVGRGLRLRRLRPAGLFPARPGADRHPAGPAEHHRALPCAPARRAPSVAAFDPAAAPGSRCRARCSSAWPPCRASGADPAEPDWKDAVGAALDAVRHGPGARIRARRRPGQPRHLLVDPRTTCGACGKPRRGTACATCPSSTTASRCWCRSTAPSGWSTEFAAWFAGACLHADAVLANSDCTRDDFAAAAAALLPDAADLPVPVLPLHAGPCCRLGVPPPASARAAAAPPALCALRRHHREPQEPPAGLQRLAYPAPPPRRGGGAGPGLRRQAGLAGRGGLRASGTAAGRCGTASACCTACPTRSWTRFTAAASSPCTTATTRAGACRSPKAWRMARCRWCRQLRPAAGGRRGGALLRPGSEPELVSRLERCSSMPGFRAAQEAKLRASPPLRSWEDLAADLAAALAAVPDAATAAARRALGCRSRRRGLSRCARFRGRSRRVAMAVADAVREGPCWGRLKEWGVRTLRGCAAAAPAGRAARDGAHHLEMQGPPSRRALRPARRHGRRGGRAVPLDRGQRPRAAVLRARGAGRGRPRTGGRDRYAGGRAPRKTAGWSAPACSASWSAPRTIFRRGSATWSARRWPRSGRRCEAPAVPAPSLQEDPRRHRHLVDQPEQVAADLEALRVEPRQGDQLVARPRPGCAGSSTSSPLARRIISAELRCRAA